jgi:lysylphosphatidylglycerol synthetase-like protein (DUF2156 family)
MAKKIGKFIYWAPRILSIIFILFLALFSLDIFGNGYGFWETVVGLFMHNIPSMVLLVVLLIAWKHELVGAVAFTLAGLIFIGLLATRRSFEWYMLSWFFTIAGPAFLTGALFYVGWRKKRKS